MHGKDIRNSEELSQYQKSMDQTLNATTIDENNETFKHDTSMCSRSRSATCEDGQGSDPELTTTIRNSVVINEYQSDMVTPNDTILTMTPAESSRKGRM